MRVSVVSESGREDGRNEDWACGTARVAIVLDGLSESPETGCIHGTPWFVRQLGSHLLGLAEDLARPLSDALSEAITRVADSHRSTCDLGHPGSPCTTVAILRDKGTTYDYLVLSDSTIVLNTNTGLHVITDKSVEQVAREEALAAQAVPFGDPEHLPRYWALIAAQQQVRNKPNGYWIAQTDPTAGRYAQTGTLAASDFHGGLVLSDGATRLVVDFEVWDWETLFKFVSTHDIAALIAETRKIEHTDAVGAQWKRYKLSDDASAVACMPEHSSFELS